MVKKQFMFIV